MSISTSDAAYGYVQQANRKEARNQVRRDKREARKQDPTPWFYLALAPFWLALAFSYLRNDNFGLTVMCGFLGCQYIVLGLKHYKRRKAAKNAS